MNYLERKALGVVTYTIEEITKYGQFSQLKDNFYFAVKTKDDKTYAITEENIEKTIAEPNTKFRPDSKKGVWLVPVRTEQEFVVNTDI